MDRTRPTLETPLPPEPEGRQLLERIRSIHGQTGGLSRVHHTHPALYAQARRAFGSWREAVAASGLDYVRERHESLKRGLTLRDQRRAVWHALSRFLLEHPAATDPFLEAERPELAGRVRRCWGGIADARSWAERRAGVLA